MVEATVRWSGSQVETATLVVLLHGRGSNETEMTPLATSLPAQFAYGALRGPVVLGPAQYTWFENRGIGRPTPESLRASLDWFTSWLDEVAATRPVVLIGFSGGCAFAAAAVLDAPHRYAGAALLYGTVPFDAGVATTPGRLAGVEVLHVQGLDDLVMPADLMSATWVYLTEQSGATLEALRLPGGHTISSAAHGQLVAWLARVAAAS